GIAALQRLIFDLLLRSFAQRSGIKISPIGGSRGCGTPEAQEVHDRRQAAYLARGRCMCIRNDRSGAAARGHILLAFGCLEASARIVQRPQLLRRYSDWPWSPSGSIFSRPPRT